MDVDTKNRKRFNAYKIVIIILTFILFNPSENDHENAVVFDYGDLKPKEEIQLRNRTIRINLILFSLTKVRHTNGSGWFINGVGVMGNVFIVN
jgi:hypothetical protein